MRGRKFENTKNRYTRQAVYAAVCVTILYHLPVQTGYSHSDMQTFAEDFVE